MNKGIQSASVSVHERELAREFLFDSGINILCGQNTEDAVFTLAGIFGGMPPQNGKAEIQWDTDAVLFVSITDGACGVEKAVTNRRNTAQQNTV